MPAFPPQLPSPPPFNLLNVWTSPTPAIWLYCFVGLFVFSIQAETLWTHINLSPKKTWSNTNLSLRWAFWVIGALAVIGYLFVWPFFWVMTRVYFRCSELDEDRDRDVGLMPLPSRLATAANTTQRPPLPTPGLGKTMTKMMTPQPSIQGNTRMSTQPGLASAPAPALATASRLPPHQRHLPETAAAVRKHIS